MHIATDEMITLGWESGLDLKTLFTNNTHVVAGTLTKFNEVVKDRTM